jgi:hypothetical protein
MGRWICGDFAYDFYREDIEYGSVNHDEDAFITERAIGMEIEIGHHNDDCELEAMIREIVESGTVRTIGSDGSVNSTYEHEITSIPLQLEGMMKFIDAMDSSGFLGGMQPMPIHDEDAQLEAGIHIHFDLSWFSSPRHLHKLCALFEDAEYRSIIKRIGRRTGNMHSRYPNTGAYTSGNLNWSDPRNTKCRSAITPISYHGTFEFRCFQSTSDADYIKQYVEDCITLIEMTRNYSLREIKEQNLMAELDREPSMTLYHA